MGTQSSKLEIKTIAEAAKEEIDYIEGRKNKDIKSLRTRWKKFNMASMDGIEWGSITTIAGMSGSGKTAILNELETSLFEENPNENFAVLSFNFEMAARRLVGRKISAKIHKTVKQLYSADVKDADQNINSDELKLAKEYANSIKDMPLYYVERPGSANEMRNTILEFVKREEIKGKGLLITLDHSILVKKGKNDNDRLSALYDLGTVANELKKDIKCSWIFLSQLNRSIEGNERRINPELHYPVKGDIFGADALYQFSDLVMVPHRPEMLNIREYGPDKLPTKDLIYWHYLKTREGEPFIAKMINDLRYNRVREYERPSTKTWGTKYF